jgi:MFS family permease
LAVTTFAASFILARALLGHLADRIGGAKVALVSVLIEAAGQAMIWRVPTALVAVLGALTGLGYSLVYPALGVEAVQRAPADSKGVATGAYTSFLDLALGIASPLMGLLAARAGLDAVFLASAVLVLAAAGVALQLLRSSGYHTPLAGRARCVDRRRIAMTACCCSGIAVTHSP